MQKYGDVKIVNKDTFDDSVFDYSKDVLLEDLGSSDYYCPDCKAKFNLNYQIQKLINLKTVEYNKKQEEMVQDDKVTVVCTGVEGIYYPSLHLSC
ncbi:histone-lysine N-methyltransferase ATX4-like isoform X2 [Rutidosis leptorrhynchoides]|uniref:histone-lysine N-methyltransferase ATX4-like isoform X2 n=1 Tax=Rutidosis leptorrhynchoides TaxID=125765 RepID=UPI003A9947C5